MPIQWFCSIAEYHPAIGIIVGLWTPGMNEGSSILYGIMFRLHALAVMELYRMVSMRNVLDDLSDVIRGTLIVLYTFKIVRPQRPAEITPVAGGAPVTYQAEFTHQVLEAGQFAYVTHKWTP